MIATYFPAPADDLAGCGLRMIFCTRQSVISDTKSSFAFRQSISCTAMNSFSCLPVTELAHDPTVQLHLIDFTIV